MHVDDGLGCSLHQPFQDELLNVLTTRYGPLTYSPAATANTGFQLHRDSHGGIELNQEGYIHRMLIDLGADHLPHVDMPGLPGFFDDPTDYTPTDANFFKKAVGKLIYTLPTRPAERPQIQHLSSRQGAPTASDYHKLVHLLAYYNATRTQGIRYFSNTTQLTAHCDASYAAHSDSRSHTGFYLSMGENNAPVYAYSAKQTKCVATGSMEAEYVALLPAAKAVVHVREFLIDLGFPQDPTTIYEDNESAINLAEAPAVTRKSKHIPVRYHYIRDLVEKKEVALQFVPTVRQTADILTKILPPKQFQRLRTNLLNLANNPIPPWSGLRGECRTLASL
jgi:hypothetical protein